VRSEGQDLGVKAARMNRNLLIRVTAPAVLIGLVLLGGSLAAARYINQLQANLTGILGENVRSLRAAQELEIRVRQLRFHSFLYLIDPTDNWLKRIDDDQRRFEEALEVVRDTAGTPEERTYLETIEAQYKKYYEEQAQMRAAVRPKPAPADVDVGKVVGDHPIDRVVKPCQELLEFTQGRMKQMEEESRRVSEQGRAAMLLLGVVGPVGGIVLGYGVARGLSRSIYRLSVRVQDMAQRLDRDVGSVSVVADGNIQDLDRQMEHIVGRVEEVAERLRQQQRALVRAEQLSAVGQLAASVAHEVRNPLTGIKLLVDSALRSKNSKPLTLEDLEVIHREVARLEQTVQGFLNFARLPAPQCSTCDLREVVGQAVELVRARARQQQVEIDVRAPHGPAPAFVDRGQLGTVLVNLFLNALDAMPLGGRLEVSLEVLPEVGVRLTVTDTGTGIPPQVAARLFTPFTTTKPTGTGLGLTISGRILEEHGGNIRAGNRPEGGASFVITLPPPPQETGHVHAAGR
jgi:signal transduction histidine kinase